MPVKIRAQNYQSIQDAEILVDRFTVVTGPNNSGKTALQRAARGVFQNQGGTAFIREGQQTCTVTVDFGGEIGKIQWSKGTGKRDRPTYVINDGKPIYPGAAVPDEVAAFGIVPISAGGQEIWPTIAPQFTGQVFLLDRPGSALAEAVADVERVGQLNRALSKAESDKRQAKAALKVRQADLAQHEAEAARYEGLDEALVLIARLDARQKQLVTLHKATTHLTDMRDKLRDAEKTADALAPVSDIATPSADEVHGLLRKLDDLTGIRARWVAAKADEAKYAGVAGLMVTVDVTGPSRLLAALDVLHGIRSRLRDAENGVVSAQTELDQAREELAEATSLADQALSDLGACPLCGTEIAGDTP